MKHGCFITHILDLVGRAVDLHLDTIGRVMDQNTTLVGRVVDVLVDQKINQQSKIFEQWIEQPNNRLQVGDT
jgi:hypothetical protein